MMYMEQIWTFFSFPLNLLLAAIWITLWWSLWKNHRSCFAVRFMLSPAATLSSISLFLLSCLWIGFSGRREFVQSVFFVIILLYLQTVLLMVLLRGWKRADGKVRWRFILLHAGLLLALGAGFWGSPDSYELRLGMAKGEETREAARLDGSIEVLPYQVCLTDYAVEISDDGKPYHYEAVITIDDGNPIHLTVNHPYKLNFGMDVYLVGISDAGCVLQVVYEPWRYFAFAGIILLIAGAVLLFIKGPER